MITYSLQILDILQSGISTLNKAFLPLHKPIHILRGECNRVLAGNSSPQNTQLRVQVLAKSAFFKVKLLYHINSLFMYNEKFLSTFISPLFFF